MGYQQMGPTTPPAQAGFTEHAVVFLVDSIKVRTSRLCPPFSAHCAFTCAERVPRGMLVSSLHLVSQ